MDRSLAVHTVHNYVIVGPWTGRTELTLNPIRTSKDSDMTNISTDPDMQLHADPALTDLPPRQAAFVLAFIDTGNAAEAARQAGYSCPTAHVAAVTGSRLAAVPAIKAAVDALRAASWEQAHASRDERLAILAGIVRGIAGDGGPPPSYSERIQAAKLVAAMSGELSPKVAIQGNQISYIVPMPPRIADADEWSRQAIASIKELDAQREQEQR